MKEEKTFIDSFEKQDITDVKDIDSSVDNENE